MKNISIMGKSGKANGLMVIYFLLFTASLSFGSVSDHILYVQLQQTWDFGNAIDPNLIYSFSITVEADSTVEYLKILTPAQKIILMTTPECSDDYGDWWKFEYDDEETDQTHLSEYGDGHCCPR